MLPLLDGIRKPLPKSVSQRQSPERSWPTNQQHHVRDQDTRDQDRGDNRHEEAEQNRDSHERDNGADQTLEQQHLARNNTLPASNALRPIVAARLNAFEPTSTPTLTLCAPFASATRAVVTSGPSVASAVSKPTSASGNPKRIPSRSSLRANKRAAASVTASDTANSGTASNGDIAAQDPPTPEGTPPHVTVWLHTWRA
jgi:hypothetical protein